MIEDGPFRPALVAILRDEPDPRVMHRQLRRVALDDSGANYLEAAAVVDARC